MNRPRYASLLTRNAVLRALCFLILGVPAYGQSGAPAGDAAVAGSGIIAPITPTEGPAGSIIRLENNSPSRWTASTVIHLNGTVANPLTQNELTGYALVEDLAGTPQRIYRKVPQGAVTGYIDSVTDGVKLMSPGEFTVLTAPEIDFMDPTEWDADDPGAPLILTLIGLFFVEYPHPSGSALPSFRYKVDYSGRPSDVSGLSGNYPYTGTIPSSDTTLLSGSTDYPGGPALSDLPPVSGDTSGTIIPGYDSPWPTDGTVPVDPWPLDGTPSSGTDGSGASTGDLPWDVSSWPPDDTMLPWTGLDIPGGTPGSDPSGTGSAPADGTPPGDPPPPAPSATDPPTIDPSAIDPSAGDPSAGLGAAPSAGLVADSGSAMPVDSSVQVTEEPGLAGTGQSRTLMLQIAPSSQTGPIRIREEMLNPITGNYDLVGEVTTPVLTIRHRPVVAQLVPDQGVAGVDQVTILGRYFDAASPGNNIVVFAGPAADGSGTPTASPATVLSVSPDGTQLTVLVPASALSGTVSVTTNARTGVSARPFTVTPSLSLVASAETVFAGTGQHIALKVAATGIDPTAVQRLTWGDLDPSMGSLSPDPADSANPLARLYLPPTTMPDTGLHVTLSASVPGGASAAAHAETTLTVLPPPLLSADPVSLDIADLAAQMAVPLVVHGSFGVDPSRIRWSLVGDLEMNSQGPGWLTAWAGAVTSYTPPPAVDKEPLIGALRGEIPELGLRVDVPVVLHQPRLSIAGYTVKSVTATTATISWSLEPGQSANTVLEYGTSPGQYNTARAASLPSPGAASLTGDSFTGAAPTGAAPAGQVVLTGLTPGTHYYFCIRATQPGCAAAALDGGIDTAPMPQIHVTPSEAILMSGATATFRADVSNGGPGARVRWALSDPEKATLSPDPADPNRVRVQFKLAAKPGEKVTLTASPDGFKGQAGNASLAAGAR